MQNMLPTDKIDIGTNVSEKKEKMTLASHRAV